MVEARKVNNLDDLGFSSFKKNLGKFAPTAPLVIVFASSSDDHRTLDVIMERVSNRFGGVVFLNAPLEKNGLAMKRYKITESPVWIAFKNHEPVARVVGTNEAEIVELVKVAFDLDESSPQRKGGKGMYGLTSPF